MRSLKPLATLSLSLLIGCASAPLADPADDDDASPTPPATCQDLNCDGWPDLVFANTEDETGDYDALSYVYWGSADGFDPTDRLELPTLGAMGAAVADLDQNGWPDIVFANVSDGSDGPDNRFVDSRVYWGSIDGFDPSRSTPLPTVGAADVTIADLNGDGWSDLVFSNRYNGASAMDAASYSIDSYIYWGSEGGFSVDARTDLPTLGAGDSAVADFNDDGWLDIAFAHGTFHTDESWLYWGSASGFSVENRLSLPSAAPEGIQAGDLDGDGTVDLFVANFYASFDLDTESTVFLNPSGSLGTDDRISLPTHGATAGAIADLNDDGEMDLVVSNSMTGPIFDSNFVVDSVIHWGGGAGLGASTTALPTTSASDVEAEDLDRDGDLDLVIANHYDAAGESSTSSVVYWNDGGFDPERKTELPTVAAAGLAVGW